MAGFDPQRTGNFGITNVSLDADGNGTITFTLDDNLDDETNESDENGEVDDKETFSYSLYDYPTANPDGALDLARKYGARRQLMAKNIEGLGFAYAFDVAGDGDNLLDTDMNGHVIWAIDSDGDNDLDVNLDEDNDGDITLHDSAAGKDLSHADNGALADVPVSDVRAVRIWLLAKGNRGDPHGINRTTYVVANQRITPDDGLTRRLLKTTVRCRNMGAVSNN
jgi:type IV pilus assembly protein PilW